MTHQRSSWRKLGDESARVGYLPMQVCRCTKLLRTKGASADGSSGGGAGDNHFGGFSTHACPFWKDCRYKGSRVLWSNVGWSNVYEQRDSGDRVMW